MINQHLIETLRGKEIWLKFRLASRARALSSAQFSAGTRAWRAGAICSTGCASIFVHISLMSQSAKCRDHRYLLCGRGSTTFPTSIAASWSRSWWRPRASVTCWNRTQERGGRLKRGGIGSEETKKSGASERWAVRLTLNGRVARPQISASGNTSSSTVGSIGSLDATERSSAAEAIRRRVSDESTAPSASSCSRSSWRPPPMQGGVVRGFNDTTGMGTEIPTTQFAMEGGRAREQLAHWSAGWYIRIRAIQGHGRNRGFPDA